MTFKGHSGPSVCPLQAQATVMLKNLNTDTVGSQRCFSAVETQKKILLYNCTVPLLTLIGPVFTRGGKLKYLTCLHNIFSGCTTIKYSAVDTFPVKTDRPAENG